MARCLVFLIYCLISTVGLQVEPAELLQLGGEVGGGQLSVDPSDVLEASRDFGGLTRGEPLAVFHPRGAGDVAALVRAAYASARGFRVSARGHGHSISGQAQAPGGVVVDMSHGWRADRGRARALLVYSPALGGHYVDVWGGELWIDVLNWTLAHGGLAPRSWTDYLYLSVGGTLSNAGISGQAFHHGPQISNVYELDVVTGKGKVVRCSETKNPDLFYGALGGLGQFGIITRAHIALEPAPQRYLASGGRTCFNYSRMFDATRAGCSPSPAFAVAPGGRDHIVTSLSDLNSGLLFDRTVQLGTDVLLIVLIMVVKVALDDQRKKNIRGVVAMALLILLVVILAFSNAAMAARQFHGDGHDQAAAGPVDVAPGLMPQSKAAGDHSSCTSDPNTRDPHRCVHHKNITA